MDEQIRQIAECLARIMCDELEPTADDIARDCEPCRRVPLAETEFDISVSMLQKIARHYGYTTDVLDVWARAQMSSYFPDTCWKAKPV